MKVQILPNGTPPRRPTPKLHTLVGALTLKPSAYQTRPWETTPLTVVNHVDGGRPLVFHLRGSTLTGITCPTGWLLDRTRFSYDGFRRQRLVAPYVRGRPSSWVTAVTVWLVTGRSTRVNYRVDPGVVHSGWLTRVYTLWKDPRGVPLSVGWDTSFVVGVYHGGYGLAGVAFSGVALPGSNPYEEDQVLSPPLGVPLGWSLAVAVVQLFVPTRGYRPAGFIPPWEVTPRVGTRALFQVSPLQALLSVSGCV